MFGIDEIYDKLLLEAKTPEEIKKIMYYQYVDGKGVPEHIFEEIFESDPTRKKNFAKWVLMRWSEEGKSIERAVKTGRLSEIFKYFQERANTGLNLLNMESFKAANRATPKENIDPIFDDDDDFDDASNDFDILYDSPIWRIASPNTYEASKRLGEGCRWCTAGAYGNGEYYYNDYTSEGKLYVNYDKRKSQIAPKNNIEYPYTRYQFLFEHGIKGELNDAFNVRIVFDEIDMPEDVLEFYGSINERYVELLTDAIDEAEINMRYNEQRIERAILRKDSPNGTLFLMPEYDEELTISDNAMYAMFHDEDLEDSIDSCRYWGEEDIISTCGNLPAVLMKTTYADFEDLEDEEVMLYFLRQSTWNDSAYWANACNILCYSVKEGNVCAIDLHRTIYHIYGPTASDVNISTLPEPQNVNYYRIREISEIAIDGLPEIFNTDKIWYLALCDSGFYSIFCYDLKTKKSFVFVDKDKPTENGFYAKEINGKYYIIGTFKKHLIHLDGPRPDDDPDEENAKYVIEDNFEDEDFYIIRNREDLRYSYGLFDKNKNKIIIKNAASITYFGDYAIVSYDEYSIIFDYKNEEIVSHKFKYGQEVDRYSYTLKYFDYSNPSDCYFFSDVMDKEYGPFKDVISVIDFNVIKVKTIDSEKEKLFNLDTCEYLLEDSEYIDVISSSLLTFEKDNRMFLYSITLNKVIAEILYDSAVRIYYDNVYGKKETIVTYRMPNGKWNMISSLKGEPLLNNGVDKILRAANHNTKDKISIIPVINNNSYILLDYPNNLSPHPSKAGINLNYVTNISFRKTFNGIILDVSLKISDNEYKVTYDFNSRSIINILDRNGNSVYDENVIKEIENIFFPEKNQISEQFINLIRRMRDL